MSKAFFAKMTETIFSAITKSTGGTYRINVHVKPGSRISMLSDTQSHGHAQIDLQIAAPPREGAANTEVLSFMAELLGLRPRQVQLVAGHRSRDKTVLVTLDLPEQAALDSVEALRGRIFTN